MDGDVHFVGDDFHLVHQADIDRAVDVFQKFGQFGSFGGADGDDFVDGGLIQRQADFQTGRCVAADDFRNGAGFKIGVARVFAFGRVNEEYVFADFQTAFFHARQQLFFGCARIGGGFQRQDLAGAQIRFHRVGGVDDETHVRFAVFVQRGRHAQNHGFHFADAGEVGGGLETGGAGGGDFVGRDVFDIGFAVVQFIDLFGVDVETQHLEAGFGVAQHQRQADVAQADDADCGGFVAEFADGGLFDFGCLHSGCLFTS